MKFIYPAVFRKTDKGTYRGFSPKREREGVSRSAKPLRRTPGEPRTQSPEIDLLRPERVISG